MAKRKPTRRRARAGAETVQSSMLNALHQVWLAGLGAAVRAQRGAPKLLAELVAEGAKFQQSKQELAEDTLRRVVGDARTRLKERIGEARGQASEVLDNLETIFQSRVQRALSQLGVPSAHELATLSKRIDVLSGNVEKLATRRAAATRTRAGGRGESKPAAPSVA